MTTRINWTMRLAVAVAATIGTPALAQLVSVELAYPPAALRAGKAGVVGYEVAIAKDGRVTRCRVTQTSGDAVLDRETCAQLRRTARFKPATDADGKPAASTFAGRLAWRVPRPAPMTAQPSPALTAQGK